MMATTTSISMALPIGMAQWLFRKNSGLTPDLKPWASTTSPSAPWPSRKPNPWLLWKAPFGSAEPKDPNMSHVCTAVRINHDDSLTRMAILEYLPPILTIIPVTLHASVLITHREYEPLIILTEYYIQLNRPNIARCLMAHPPLHDDPKTISTLICIQEGPIVYV